MTQRVTPDDDEFEAMALDATESSVIEVMEETATIDVAERVSGRVRVQTATTTVEETLTQDLRGTRTEVVRVPIGRTLEQGEAAPSVRTEGNVTIVPVLEEIAVVEVRVVLREELHITRHDEVETVSIPVTLRKQTATVERDGPTDQSNEAEERTRS